MVELHLQRAGWLCFVTERTPCIPMHEHHEHYVDRADAEVTAFRSRGNRVGLHPGYNVAQRLYVKHGYTPHGRGVTNRDRYVNEGSHVLLDDDFVLGYTKQLRSGTDHRNKPSSEVLFSAYRH